MKPTKELKQEIRRQIESRFRSLHELGLLDLVAKANHDKLQALIDWHREGAIDDALHAIYMQNPSKRKAGGK